MLTYDHRWFTVVSGEDIAHATTTPQSPALILLVFAFLLFLRATLTAQDFRKEVICQIITDRFFGGDPTNNDPPQSRGMYDATKTNWQAYWGDDLVGIQEKLPYLQAMGVTAL